MQPCLESYKAKLSTKTPIAVAELLSKSPIAYFDPFCVQIPNFISEYYPQNIMFDKRVARGSTYAAMVIPAGQNPDAMMTEKRDANKSKSLKKLQTVF